MPLRPSVALLRTPLILVLLPLLLPLLDLPPPVLLLCVSQSDINQTVILAQYEALASKERTVDGIPTSLCDLGFCDAGIDDGWQACFSGPGGVGFHNETGWPNVNLTRFPDLRALTARARALGLKPGWYGSNDGCSDKSARLRFKRTALTSALLAMSLQRSTMDLRVPVSANVLRRLACMQARATCHGEIVWCYRNLSSTTAAHLRGT